MQRSRLLTFQPLSLTIHSINAPTASGSDVSIATAETLREPYGSGTGNAITAGRPFRSGRWGESGTYPACSVASSPVITGANAAFTHAWISGTLRKLVVRFRSLAPQSPSRLQTSR